MSKKLTKTDLKYFSPSKSDFNVTCATPISASLFTAAVWAFPKKK